MLQPGAPGLACRLRRSHSSDSSDSSLGEAEHSQQSDSPTLVCAPSNLVVGIEQRAVTLVATNIRRYHKCIPMQADAQEEALCMLHK